MEARFYLFNNPCYLITQSLLRKHQNIGNKAKGRISKRVFQETKHAKFSEKRTKMLVKNGVKNVRFSENLACCVFLKYPF